GLEFLAGIPGLVGGAVAMNADARFGDVQQSVQDRLKKVEVAVLKENDTNQVETKEYSTDKLRFEYRKNLFLQPNEIILNCYWEIAQTDPKEIKTKIRSLLKKRKETQPINFPSCGSVFKNVTEKDGTKISAWQVIDKLGLKGAKIGNAQFSEIHGNFIVNLGSAKAADVKALIELAKQRAKNELQIILEEEVVYLE
ncbi:MAG: UDP-N-acetylenolpyruvoylglucosamine reductase, partial [Bdellovibrionales bacterium RIFOXYD1_FULL_44_7]